MEGPFRPVRSFGMLVAAMLFWLAGLLTGAVRAAFEVEGELTRGIHDNRRTDYEGEEGQGKAGPLRYQFSVTVADRRYFIRVVPLFDQTVPESRFVEAGFDGEQQYIYCRSGHRSGVTEEGVNQTADLAYLSWESVPVADPEPVIPPLWLAFASGSLLRDETQPARLPPLWAVPVPLSLRDQVSFPCRFELLEGAYPLPRHVEMHWEGIYYGYEPTQGLLRFRSADPGDSGWVKVEYAVEETVTVNGAQLPQSARFREYVRVSRDQQHEHRLVQALDIRVTNALATVRRRDFVPVIVTKTTIIDGRRVGNPVVADYSSTNWPRFDEPRVRYAFRKADEAHRETLFFLSQRRSWRLTRLIFFAALTATVIVALVQWLRRKPTYKSE